MSLTRVLLVDDHVLVRAGIRALVDMIDGVEVVGEAGNGSEALRLTEALQPDLVLLDITMPGLNGLTTLEQITSQFPKVRVVMLTMHEAREYAMQALRGGAAGFIPKSAASTELRQAIETVMGGKTYLSHETALENRPATAKAAQEQEILQRLTPRQRQILILIAEGKSTKEIAASLNISGKTVES
ncbi:MAG TPA: response regulator transcription factor, partial [Pyrinomonadaceae bacterium]|nr:response regulator transcription factor [Pyrinomonadaceae bacterium]